MSMTPQSVRVLFFCIFILLLVLQSAYVPIRHSGVRALFVRSVLVAITSCLLYIGTYPGFFGADGIFLTRAFNGLYFAVTALLPWMWLVYMVRRVFIKPSLSTWIRILISLPVAFFAVASVLSIWNGWVFYVDAADGYMRGPLYLPYVAILGVYLLVPMFGCLSRAFNKRFYVDRSMYLSLSSFGFFTIVGMTLEVFFPDLPSSAMGMALTLLTNHLSDQRGQVSADPLTKLNNRNQFNIYLDRLIQNPPVEGKAYLFVLDMDKFKHINDDFGHMKGDEALLIVSNVLKKVCGPKGHFISRFGGDEFVVVAKYNGEQECDGLVQEIKAALAEASANFVCPLSVSIGYDAVKESGETIPDLFNRADKKLYKIKKSR